MSNILGVGNEYITLDTPVNDLYKADGSLDMNNNTIINLQDPVYTQDAATKAYVDANAGINEGFADGRYYLNSTTLDGIQLATSDINANYNKITNLSNATLGTDALNRQTADGRYYANTTKLNNIVVPNGSLDMNSNKITNLSNGTLAQDAITKTQLDNDYKNKIQTTNTTNSVSCQNNDITFNITSTEKLKIYAPTGQSTNPTGIVVNDKLQFTSGQGSYSFGTSKTQVVTPGFNTNGVSIQMANDMTKNQNCQLSLQCANASGSQLSQCLTIDCGHVDVGAGQQNYSLIYNKAVEGVQQNLQISGGTPQSDNTINLYSTSFATLLGFNNTIQFTGKTGYNGNIACTETYQFTPKTYVDTLLTSYVTNSSLTTTLGNYVTGAYLGLNYYTKTQSNALYQTLAGMSSYVTNSSLSTTLSSYITSTYLTANYYTQTYINDTFVTIASLGTYITQSMLNTQLASYALITSLSNYYPTTTTLNNITAPTGSVSLNSQKIINVANPTLANDATNKSYVDANVLSLTSLSGYIRTGSIKVGNIGNYNIGSAVTTGALTSGTKAYYQGGNLMTLNYQNDGYIPIVQCQWLDPTSGSSTPNDVSILAILTMTATQTTIYLESTSANTNNGTIYVSMFNPGLV